MLSDDWLVDEFEAMDLSRSCLSDAKEGFHSHEIRAKDLWTALSLCPVNGRPRFLSAKKVPGKGQSISSFGKVPIEIIPRKRNIT